MPELPEVETVRRGLEHHAVGRVVEGVEVRHPRAVRRQPGGADGFGGMLRGRRLVAARRRGKYLWLPLDSGDALVGHLGMSGQLLVGPMAADGEAHLRIRLRLGREGTRAATDLRFVDQRTFGTMFVSTGGAHLPAEIAGIALDPFDPRFDDAGFASSLRLRRTGVKRALLDQSLVSGIGNIYADEALWACGVHYAQATSSVDEALARRLLAALRSVMGAALAAGGTSFDSLYVDVNGSSGYFDRSLNVYGRRGLPCPRCGSPITREAFMNRSSFRCPSCQPRPERPHAAPTSGRDAAHPAGRP